MTEFLLVRHGQTDWNQAARLQGHRDIPLNASGQNEARALARRLATEHIDAFYASDLARAFETAAAAAARHAKPVMALPSLRERAYGIFEGLTRDEIRLRHPLEAARWEGHDGSYRIPEGESFAALRRRALAALVEVAGRHGGGRVVVVTHGGVLEAVYRAAHGLADDGPRPCTIAHAALNRARCDAGRWFVVSWGDVGHLDAEALQRSGARDVEGAE